MLAEGSSGSGARRAWAFAGIVIALLALNYAFGWSDTLFGTDSVAMLKDLVSSRPVEAALIYLAASIVACVALAMPGFVFAVVAGAVFGPWWGTLLCWLAVSVGACLAFLVGRHFLKDAIKPRLQASPALNRILFDGAERSDVYLLAITRLVPVFPYNLQNFAYGITDVGFGRYALFSALFLLPGTAAYTLASAGVVGSGGNRLLYIGLAAALLALAMVAARVLKGRAGIEEDA